MDKRTAFEIVFEELKKTPGFIGKYNPKHTSADFMDGVQVVMGSIAHNISPDLADAFWEEFNQNCMESERKAAIGE